MDAKGQLRNRAASSFRTPRRLPPRERSTCDHGGKRPRYPAGSRASRKSAGSRPRTTQPTAHAQPVRPAASARKARKSQGFGKGARGVRKPQGSGKSARGVRKPQNSGKSARVRAGRSGPESLPDLFPEPSPIRPDPRVRRPNSSGRRAGFKKPRLSCRQPEATECCQLMIVEKGPSPCRRRRGLATRHARAPAHSRIVRD